MSNLEDKLSYPERKWDGGQCRARLKQHLAGKGYIVTESDASGPYRIIVNGMELQRWVRDQKDGKDWWFRLESSEPWLYE